MDISLDATLGSVLREPYIAYRGFTLEFRDFTTKEFSIEKIRMFREKILMKLLVQRLEEMRLVYGRHKNILRDHGSRYIPTFLRN